MKKTTCILIGLLAGLNLWAGPVSREQALSQAREFMASKGVMMTTAKTAYRAPRKVSQTSDQAYYYVFNVGQEQGFVIMSGDDRTEQVLGYCDHGTFDAENMPENMLSFLQGYADQIKWMDDNNIQTSQLDKAKAPRRIKPVRRAINPLMKSKWNQGDPYNRMCPEYYTTDGGHGDHSATGCVATAIAQVINYWKFPNKIARSISTHSNTYKTKVTRLDDEGNEYQKDTTIVVSLPRINAGEEIDWEHMCDIYTSANTDEEKDAVAKLMLMVGQAIKMGYGASSGASHSQAMTVYKDIFGFDDSGLAASRTGYTHEEWHDMLYNDLAAGHPISYSGHSTGGGHAFVVDGYDGEGLFHVNWGWGGSSDGYFRIDVLNPGDNTGIGASSSSDGYSMTQYAMLNVKLPDGIDDTQLKMTINSVTLTEMDGKPAIRSGYRNQTGSLNTFETGIGFQKEDGTFMPIGQTDEFSLANNTTSTRTYIIEGLDPGTYKVAPIGRVKGYSAWNTSFIMGSEWIEVNVDADGNVNAQRINSSTGLTVQDIVFTGDQKAGSKQTVDVTFANSVGDYFGTVYFFASMTDVKGTAACRSAVSLTKDKPNTISFYFNTEAEQTGTWHVWVATNSQGSAVIGESEVEITKKGNTAATGYILSLVSNKITNKEGNNIYGGVISGQLTLKNTGTEDYDGTIKVQLWRKNIEDNIYWTNGAANLHYQIPAGSSSTLSYIFTGKETNRTFGISVSNLNTNESISGLTRMGDLKEGILLYMANGQILGKASSLTVQTPNSSAAVDLRGIHSARIQDPGYKNTIYFIDEDAEIEGLDGLNVVRGKHAEEIHLQDGLAYVSPMEFTADKVTFTRTFAKGSTGKDNWTALNLPFEPASVACEGTELRWKADEEEKDLYLKEFAYLEDDNTVKFDFVDKILAQTPYVMAVPFAYVGKPIVMSAEEVTMPSTTDNQPKVVSDAYNFYGTWITDRLSGVYVVNSDGTAFEPASRASQVTGMRAYFVSKLPKEESAEKIVICDEFLTGIKKVKGEKAEASEAYNLQGQRVERPSKGVFIVGGKKVVIK